MGLTVAKLQQLQAAARAAASHNAWQAADSPSLSCPLPPRQALEVVVVGEDNEPLMSIAVQLRNSQGQVIRTKTDMDGHVRFEGLEESSYQLSLYALDQDAWEKIAESALPADKATSQGQPHWVSAAAPETPHPELTSHIARQGDCFSRIAAMYGFLPDTLWDAPENAALKQQRASKNILNPGDHLILPRKRQKSEGVSVGQLYRLCLKGVPEILRIRFLTHGAVPRHGLPYVLKIRTAQGKRIQDKTGETNSEGFLSEAIPPDADAGQIILGTGLDQEVFDIQLGYVDPIDTISGVQARLNNLGYHCAGEHNVLGAKTQTALESFQRDNHLAITGAVDEATRARLQALYLS